MTDLRAIAIKAAVELPPRQAGDKWIVDLADVADAVLAAVSPVIRQQERERIAQSIDEEVNFEARKMWPSSPTIKALRAAAAIARSHSTQPTEEETTGD